MISWSVMTPSNGVPSLCCCASVTSTYLGTQCTLLDRFQVQFWAGKAFSFSSNPTPSTFLSSLLNIHCHMWLFLFPLELLSHNAQMVDCAWLRHKAGTIFSFVLHPSQFCILSIVILPHTLFFCTHPPHPLLHRLHTRHSHQIYICSALYHSSPVHSELHCFGAQAHHTACSFQQVSGPVLGQESLQLFSPSNILSLLCIYVCISSHSLSLYNWANQPQHTDTKLGMVSGNPGPRVRNQQAI